MKRKIHYDHLIFYSANDQVTNILNEKVNIVSLKKVRSRLGYGYKWIYLPDQLSRIIEEPSDVIKEESLSESWSDTDDALSEYGWLENSDSDEPIHPVVRSADYEIYCTLLNTVTILRQSGCEEFKHYQTAFDDYLKNYSTYLNTSDSFLEKIKLIHSERNNESGCCFSFFKKKLPTSPITNKLITAIIHSNMQIDLVSIQGIQGLARESETAPSTSPL